MTFDEIMAAIAKTENGSDLVDGIKKRLNDVNNSDKNQRTRRKAAESDLEKLKNTKNPVLEELSNLGLSFSEGDNIKDVINNFVKTSMDNTDNKDFDITKHSDYIKMQKQVTLLTEKDTQSEIDNKALKIKSNQKEIINTLNNSFNAEIMNGSKVLKLLVENNSSNFLINEKEEVCFKLTDGEEITGIENIMKKYKEINSGEILNKQKSGGDSQSNETYVPPSEFNDISELRKLSAPQWVEMQTKKPEQYKQAMSILAEKH